MKVADVKNKISPILGDFGIEYAGVFGSIARGEDRPDSDVDILVRFGKPLGMFLYMRMVNNLEEVLGRKVDVVTENSLNRFVRPFVMPEVKTIYEK
jgi:predicted nucleotidyltransferase